MDKIVVMKDGEISEQGTYQELLTSGGQVTALKP
jgi:ABC-type multidrug transport system fused ATPase/permease subunit